MEYDHFMSKDKIYGYGISIITVVFLILYTLYLPLQQYFPDLVEGLNPLGVTVIDAMLWPVYLATLMIGFIIAWIGITMATTPPPETDKCGGPTASACTNPGRTDTIENCNTQGGLTCRC